MNNNFDVIIVGGGIVGISLALALAKFLPRIALIEATAFKAQKEKLENQRTIVIAHSSRMILESINVWHELKGYASPINTIHVSDKGQFGSSKIRASDENLSALGYVLPAETINSTLHTSLLATKNVTVFQPAQFLALQQEGNRITLSVQHGEDRVELSAELLVAADGQNSSIRQSQGIRHEVTSYDQTAIVCNLQLKRSHHGVAYERFTAQGPLAMLPLLENRVAMIWTVAAKEATRIMNLNSSEFLQVAQANFGYRLGKFEQATSRTAIPLQLLKTKQQVKRNLVLMGNAVHTLHPVAGQGLNLALRDLAVLAEELRSATLQKMNLGELALLERYQERRWQDQEQVINLTNFLVGIFSNSLLPIMLTRSSGLILLDRMKWLKKIFTKRALGYTGTIPRLACGLSLDS